MQEYKDLAPFSDTGIVQSCDCFFLTFLSLASTMLKSQNIGCPLKIYIHISNNYKANVY